MARGPSSKRRSYDPLQLKAKGAETSWLRKRAPGPWERRLVVASRGWQGEMAGVIAKPPLIATTAFSPEALPRILPATHRPPPRDGRERPTATDWPRTLRRPRGQPLAVPAFAPPTHRTERGHREWSEASATPSVGSWRNSEDQEPGPGFDGYRQDSEAGPPLPTANGAPPGCSLGQRYGSILLRRLDGFVSVGPPSRRPGWSWLCPSIPTSS